MTTVAVVGLGGMGSRIAAKLLDAGETVLVWNRSEEPARALAEAGAEAVATPKAAAERSDVLITMLADPAALDDVTDGPEGIAGGAGDHLTVIEMSTVGPDAIRRLRTRLPSGCGLVDAPVLGSLSEVEAGTLQVFAGGPAGLVRRWTPLLSKLGTVIPVGELTSGAAAKLVANSTLLGVLTVLGEAVALGDGLGLDRDATLAVLGVSPLAAQVERRRAAIRDEPAPTRFRLALARKDAELVCRAGEDHGVDMRAARAALSWLADAEENGRGDDDYSAILGHVIRSRGTAPRRRPESR